MMTKTGETLQKKGIIAFEASHILNIVLKTASSKVKTLGFEI